MASSRSGRALTINLKTLRGFKFDWSRNDAIWDHVYANQALTHKLNEFGIVHEAEEYNGLWDADPYWGAEGRVIAVIVILLVKE
jgi:hypothetical protein